MKKKWREYREIAKKIENSHVIEVDTRAPSWAKVNNTNLNKLHNNFEAKFKVADGHPCAFVMEGKNLFVPVDISNQVLCQPAKFELSR